MSFDPAVGDLVEFDICGPYRGIVVAAVDPGSGMVPYIRQTSWTDIPLKKNGDASYIAPGEPNILVLVDGECFRIGRKKARGVSMCILARFKNAV